jgi:hypothetical protein
LYQFDAVFQSVLVAPRQITFPFTGVVDKDGVDTFQEYSVHELALQEVEHPPATLILILFTLPATALKDGRVVDVVDQVVPLSVE